MLQESVGSSGRQRFVHKKAIREKGEKEKDIRKLVDPIPRDSTNNSISCFEPFSHCCSLQWPRENCVMSHVRVPQEREMWEWKLGAWSPFLKFRIKAQVWACLVNSSQSAGEQKDGQSAQVSSQSGNLGPNTKHVIVLGQISSLPPSQSLFQPVYLQIQNPFIFYHSACL